MASASRRGYDDGAGGSMDRRGRSRGPHDTTTRVRFLPVPLRYRTMLLGNGYQISELSDIRIRLNINMDIRIRIRI